MLGRLLDNLIAPFAPRTALARRVARIQSDVLRQQVAQLNTYGAADIGRRNNDWVGPQVTSGSADLAIIQDSRILNMRARQMARDSWIVSSAIKAASRNIVGKGIIPVPAAHDGDGKPLVRVNARLERLFWPWANRAKACDVEQRQNFWQKQALMVAERFTVGEAFLVWSYTPPERPTDPVGLRFQSFEAEMLDLTKQWYASNEVRGGVEIDDEGRPVAYHFWTRNPADYLFRRQMHSVRIPATRVLHYFKQERVLQTRGVTPLSPVLQKIRDFDRFEQAHLWAAIMEACHGGAITKTVPTPTGYVPGLTPASNDPGTTSSGMRKFDFVPGMMFELGPGEKIEWNNPQKPGGQYGPYTDVSLRGIGAGIGVSYGLLARHFDGNYSAARQDMLEDDKQWGPEQDLITDSTIDPLYVLFVRFAALEGRLDDLADEFNAGEMLMDENRFTDSDIITPAKPWIDPEKEMNAAEKALQNQLKTRGQLIAEMGGRIRNVFAQKAQENTLAEELHLELPEDKLPAFRRDLLKTIAADRNTGTAVTNAMDIKLALDEVGAPIRQGFKQQDVAAPSPGTPGQGGPPAAPPGGGPVDKPSTQLGAESADTWSDSFSPAGPPQQPPNYKLAVLPEIRCGTCSHLDVSAQASPIVRNDFGAEQARPFCRKFSIGVQKDHTCDQWTAAPIDANTNVNRGRTLPPTPAPGSPGIERSFQNPARRDTTT